MAQTGTDLITLIITRSVDIVRGIIMGMGTTTARGGPALPSVSATAAAAAGLHLQEAAPPGAMAMVTEPMDMVPITAVVPTALATEGSLVLPSHVICSPWAPPWWLYTCTEKDRPMDPQRCCQACQLQDQNVACVKCSHRGGCTCVLKGTMWLLGIAARHVSCKTRMWLAKSAQAERLIGACQGPDIFRQLEHTALCRHF